MATTNRAQNWAQNLTYRAARRHRPTSVADLQASGRVVGRGSSRSAPGTASTTSPTPTATRWTSSALPPVARDRPRGRATVRVGAGCATATSPRRWTRAGFALHNLASLPHISVAGAVATGTHGSGDRNGTSPRRSSALELVTADGELRHAARAATLTLRRRGRRARRARRRHPRDPRRRAHASTSARTSTSGLTWDSAARRTSTTISAARLQRQPVHATGGDAVDQVWLKRAAGRRPRAAGECFGARAATERPRHAGPAAPAENCTEQLGVPGPWHERLPHFRLDFTPSSGEELQTEYFVPRGTRVEAIARGLRALGDRIAPLLQISEIRTIAADDLWLSPALRAATPSRCTSPGGPTSAVVRAARRRSRTRWRRSTPGRTGASSSPPAPTVDAPYPRIATSARWCRARPAGHVPQRLP